MGSGIYEEEVNPLQEVGISNEFTRHDLVEISRKAESIYRSMFGI